MFLDVGKLYNFANELHTNPRLGVISLFPLYNYTQAYNINDKANINIHNFASSNCTVVQGLYSLNGKTTRSHKISKPREKGSESSNRPGLRFNIR